MFSVSPPVFDPRLRPVTSKQNALVKDLRGAFARCSLTANGCLAIESPRMVEEAIRSGLKFEAVFFAESAAGPSARLLPQFGRQAQLLLLPGDVFAGAVNTESPQGVAALVRLPPSSLEDMLSAPHPLILVAAGIQDPGNLGALMRSAEAFGAHGVIVGETSVSHFNPKVVRAAAGSLFRLPIVRISLENAVAALRGRGLRLLATSSHTGDPLPQADLKTGVAVFIGNEGAGLPRAILKSMDATLSIPHSSRVESLNAGMAASIVLYEATRQRKSFLTPSELPVSANKGPVNKSYSNKSPINKVPANKGSQI